MFSELHLRLNIIVNVSDSLLHSASNNDIPIRLYVKINGGEKKYFLTWGLEFLGPRFWSLHWL